VPVLVFDTGDMFLKNPDQIERELPVLRHKGPVMMKATSLMGYDAANVGWLDQLLPQKMLAAFDNASSFPFISANLRTSTGESPFPHFVIKEYGDFTVGIFGLVSPQPVPFPQGKTSPYRTLDPIVTGREMAAELKKTCDLVIALTSLGKDADLELAREVPDIDIVLGGLSRTVMYQPGIEQNAVVVQAGSKGMRVGLMELAFRRGAGGPWVEEKKAGPDDGRTFRWAPVQLHKKIVDHGDMLPLLAEYKETLREHQVAAAAAAPRKRKSPFRGAVGCGECHPKETMRWAVTAHARAYITLVKKRQETNPDCLDCHVTGYNVAGGFTPGVMEPDLRAVQCEACHGPGARHKGRAGIRLQVPEEVCRGCHNTENSPAFRYRAYLKKLGEHTSGALLRR